MPKDMTSNPNGSPSQPLPKQPSNVDCTAEPRESDKKPPAGPEKSNLVDTSGYTTLPSPAAGSDATPVHNR